MHFQKDKNKFLKTLGKTIVEYGLLEAEDRLLVAVSGGVDSLTLLHALVMRQKISPVPFHLEAIHVEIDGVPNVVDVESIQSFCKTLNVKLNLLQTKIDYSNDKRNSPCYLCSQYRRTSVFKFTQEHNFQKLAFGHHMDDLLETLLMNMAHHAEISTMPPYLKMRKWDFDLIRPLVTLTKREIARYAKAENIAPAEGRCEFETKNSRSAISDILDQLHQINPQSKINLFNSMQNIVEDYLPRKVQ